MPARRDSIRHELEYFEQQNPDGGLILPDHRGGLNLGYYLGGDGRPPFPPESVTQFRSGHQVLSRHAAMDSFRTVVESLRGWRARQEFTGDESVWVFSVCRCALCIELKEQTALAEDLSGLRQFGETVLLFRAPISLEDHRDTEGDVQSR